MSATGAELVRYLRTLAAGRANDACTDRQLLEQFVSCREQASFAALVRRHGPMVLNVCRRVLGQDQDAEDAFQATFLVLARKAGTIRKQDSVSSWLHGVAYHIALKLRTREARRLAHERKSASRAAVDPVEDVAWREIRCLLDSELARLPEQYRGPLVLCYLQGKTQDEAARQLEWSLRTFRRRLKCARDLLIRRLKRRGVSLSIALTAPLLIDSTAAATLPPLLAASTIRAGMGAATGQATGGLVSAQVAALAEGSAAPFLAKKASITIVLLISLALGVGGLLAGRAVSSRTLAEAPAASPSQSPPARSASKGEAAEIKGRVLGPDGKPVAGAKVYVSTYTYKDKSDPKVRAESDAEGRFHFTASRTEIDESEMVVAVAPDHGPDWVSLKEARNGKELTLRLVKDDVPIKGRILDLEGKPIAGATIRLQRLRKMPGEDLTPWLKELQAKPNDRNAVGDVQVRYEQILSSLAGVLGLPKFVKTGADGRFQLDGMGRERVVQLHIEGPGIEYRTVSVMTRPGLAKGMSLGMYGAVFDHLAAPSKPIRGTVSEKATGKPVAGAHVHCQPAAGEEGESAISDKDGHYEIPGIRKAEHYFVNVGGPSIINYYKEPDDTPGLQPVTVNFEVERGLVLRVRVTEKDTGRPVRGMVQYAIASDNRNLDRYTTYPRNAVGCSFNEKDGTFDQIVLPGPGYVAFRADEPYARSRPKGKENDRFLAGGLLQPLVLEIFHAVAPINPSENDPQSLVCNIVLDRGRTLTGSVVDPEGQPLKGTKVCGLHAVMSLHSNLEADATLQTPSFTVTGMDPQSPRGLVFYHTAKKLAKTVMVHGDEKGPLTIRLEPLGAFTGRLVDAAGKPQVGVEVSALLGEKQQSSLPGELVFANSPLYSVLFSGKARTDKEGRFRIEGTVAGMKYDLGIGRGGQFAGRVLKDVAGKAGETVDVGEIKRAMPSAKK